MDFGRTQFFFIINNTTELCSLRRAPPEQDTVFRRINAPGAEAENEPSTWCDCVDSGIPQHYVLKIQLRSVQSFLRYRQVKSKVGGTFIQAGAFIRQNVVYLWASHHWKVPVSFRVAIL